MEAASTDIRTIRNRYFGVVDVRHVLNQRSGMVRVEIVSGENKGASFVIAPEQWERATKAA